MAQRGFTLIETLVALAIAATALIALMGRLGASSELQRKLIAQAVAVDEARNLLTQDMLKGYVAGDERRGAHMLGDREVRWRLWSERTMSGQLVRRNVQVAVGRDGEFRLFVYRRKP